MLSFALLSVFVVEFALYYFGGVQLAPTYLMQMLVDPSSIQNSWIFTAFFYAIVAIGVAGVISSFYYQVNQWAFFAIGCSLILAFVSVFAQLWIYLSNAIGAPPAVPNGLGPLVATILTAPLIILYLSAVVEWSRFNQ